jgi:hypothetical protein
MNGAIFHGLQDTFEARDIRLGQEYSFCAIRHNMLQAATQQWSIYGSTIVLFGEWNVRKGINAARISREDGVWKEMVMWVGKMTV